MLQIVSEILGSLVRGVLLYLAALPVFLLMGTPLILVRAIVSEPPYWRAVMRLYRNFIHGISELFVIAPWP